MMSGTNNLKSAAADIMCCASCGIAEGDDIKLKTCTACRSARYCSVKCQKDHRPKHKGECRKRAAKLRDELLFKQPESSHLGDCPICCLPLSFEGKYSTMMACCSKIICNGCVCANQMRDVEGNLLQYKCPFCRHAPPKSQEESDMQMMKRAQANDPFATLQIGIRRNEEGNYEGAFQNYTKAAESGNAASHYFLSCLYREGKFVEMDEKKEVYHLEQAAIGGEPFARYNLGLVELKNGRHARAAKHFIIAAKLGHDGSLRTLKDWYRFGLVSKENFAAALRGHQAAVDATKSPQREAAEAFQRRHGLHAAAQASTTSLKRNPEYRE